MNDAHPPAVPGAVERKPRELVPERIAICYLAIRSTRVSCDIHDKHGFTAMRCSPARAAAASPIQRSRLCQPPSPRPVLVCEGSPLSNARPENLSIAERRTQRAAPSSTVVMSIRRNRRYALEIERPS